VFTKKQSKPFKGNEAHKIVSINLLSLRIINNQALIGQNSNK